MGRYRSIGGETHGGGGGGRKKKNHAKRPKSFKLNKTSETGLRERGVGQKIKIKRKNGDVNPSNTPANQKNWT